MFEDKEWAQYLLGALKPLSEVYSWYEAGDMSPEEAAEAFRLIVQDAPYNLRTCPNPAGGRIFRVNTLGKVQELNDAGEWQDPSGDAEIPPVPEREGGTPDDQICLAAKNATNVLLQLYENVTDSFNEGLDEAEALTALILSIIALIGSEFAPITFALVTFFSVVFSVLYGVLEFVGADLWDENFTSQMVCILRDCATNDAGVVTFDWDCFENKLAAQTNVFDLTFEQLRLFGQIEYLLQVIGGVDALNAAGATTAITDDDCSYCAPHCFYIDLRLTNGSGLGVHITGGTWVSGQGIQGADFGANNKSNAYGYWDFGEEISAVAIYLLFTKTAGGGANNINHFNALNPATAYNSTTIASENSNPLGTSITKGLEVNGLLAGMGWDVNSGTNATPLYIEGLMVTYEGDIPSGWSDNCP